MYLGLLRRRTITFTTNTISAHRHPLFRGFSSGKYHAAQIVSYDLGSAGITCYLALLVLKRFLWRVVLFIIEIHGLESILLSCIYLTCCPSVLCLVFISQIRSVMVDPGFPWICLISAWLGLANGLNVPATRWILFANPRRDCSGDRLYASFQASFGFSFLLSYVFARLNYAWDVPILQ